MGGTEHTAVEDLDKADVVATNGDAGNIHILGIGPGVVLGLPADISLSYASLIRITYTTNNLLEFSYIEDRRSDGFTTTLLVYVINFPALPPE